MATPSASRVWSARYHRALKRPGEDGRPREHSERHIRLIHELLYVEHELVAKFKLVQGRWVDNPHRGDREHADRRRREVWAEMGEWLGIGPPPASFFGSDE
jgi:hypothetical protein